MEFLRFGSSIPGRYWGCCACDIIQDFQYDPSTKASIQLVDGDGGCALGSYAGPTYLDIFKQRIRYGTFSDRDMPNHAFIAILTENQLQTQVGKKWLAILKEHGFEFIRSVSNSVYTGETISGYTQKRGSNKNYIFMMVRNIGSKGDGDCFTPPEAWVKLPSVMKEAWQVIPEETRFSLAANQHDAHTVIWKDVGPAKFFSEQELESMGVPIELAGQRSQYPQQLKQYRTTKKQQSSQVFSAVLN